MKIPELDALRGLAIIPVLFFHLRSKVPLLPIDFLAYSAGVDLFFVISGFLITGILIDQKGQDHYLRNFYVRRALRIWPLYLALLIFTFILLPAVIPGLRQRIFMQSHPWWSYLLFLQNFLVHHFGIGPVGVTWSLAIEEQFYLAWPFIVRYMSVKSIAKTCIAVLCATVLLRFFLLWIGIDYVTIGVNTFTRLDGLSLGGLLACGYRLGFSGQQVKLFGKLSIAAGLLLLAIWFISGLNIISPVGDSIGYLIYALVFVGCIPLCLGWRQMRMGWLMYTGKISYGLYLLHMIIFDIVDVLARPQSRFAQLIVCGLDLLLVFVIASLSWVYLESPFLRLKDRFAPSVPADILLEKVHG